MVHIPAFLSGDEPPLAKEPSEVPQEPYFLFVGRLVKIKGLQTLIPIFRRYSKARLLVAGTGRYERRLRRQAKGSVNITFLGQQSARQLRRLYRHALGLIVPSIAYEVAPLVTLEAFRQRTPVIVRNLGGLPEYIEESGGGFVYDTEEELIAAMDRLLADPSYRNELGMRGYRTYRQKWTAEAYLECYFALIQDIAATSPGSRRFC